MPPKTASKTPVIVYLDDEQHAELEQLARDEDRSASAMARRLIGEALAARRRRRRRG